MVLIRDKIRPDLEQEVDPREAYALRQGGLLVEDDNDAIPDSDPSQNTAEVDERERVEAANQAQRERDEAANQAQGEGKKEPPKAQAKSQVKNSERS